MAYTDKLSLNADGFLFQNSKCEEVRAIDVILEALYHDTDKASEYVRNTSINENSFISTREAKKLFKSMLSEQEARKKILGMFAAKQIVLSRYYRSIFDSQIRMSQTYIDSFGKDWACNSALYVSIFRFVNRDNWKTLNDYDFLWILLRNNVVKRNPLCGGVVAADDWASFFELKTETTSINGMEGIREILHPKYSSIKTFLPMIEDSGFIFYGRDPSLYKSSDFIFQLLEEQGNVICPSCSKMRGQCLKATM